MKELLVKSENFRQEYSATIVKVGALKDIENSDNLKLVVIDGFSVVVNKNEVKEGDIMVYCKNETELNAKFLSVNNLYEIGEWRLNANHEEVERLLSEGRKDDAKALVGYFNKHGRVKMLKLRGCPSIGILIRPSSLVNWKSELADLNWEDYMRYDENGNAIPYDFDTVCGQLFIQPYVPKNNGKAHPTNNGKAHIGGFDRIVDGEWTFHYETNQLNSNMWLFKPDDVVTISCKMHGTSVVLGNVLTKRPTPTNSAIKWFNKSIEKKIKGVLKSKRNPYDKSAENVVKRLAERKVKNHTIAYDDVYSSRTVIKNRYIYNNVKPEDVELDIWGEYYELFHGLIPEGMSIYGEIVGYLSGSQSMVQKNYDYGCPPGENKIMIYRITQKVEGVVREYNPLEVVEITRELVAKYKQLERKVLCLPVLYHGRFDDLYPDVVPDSHWNENVLERMKVDDKLLGMEMDEPLCKMKVPREGVCIRIDDDVIPECFKLKASKFLLKEAKEIDAGNVDIEMMSAY